MRKEARAALWGIVFFAGCGWAVWGLWHAVGPGWCGVVGGVVTAFVGGAGMTGAQEGPR